MENNNNLTLTLLQQLVEIDSQLFRLLSCQNIFTKRFSYKRTKIKVDQYIQIMHSYMEDPEKDVIKMKAILHYYNIPTLLDRLEWAKQQNEEYLNKHNRITINQKNFKYDTGMEVDFNKKELTDKENPEIGVSFPFSHDEFTGRIDIQSIQYFYQSKEEYELNVAFSISINETTKDRKDFTAIIANPKGNYSTLSFKTTGIMTKNFSMSVPGEKGDFNQFNFILFYNHRYKVFSFTYNRFNKKISIL